MNGRRSRANQKSSRPWDALKVHGIRNARLPQSIFPFVLFTLYKIARYVSTSSSLLLAIYLSLSVDEVRRILIPLSSRYLICLMKGAEGTPGGGRNEGRRESIGTRWGRSGVSFQRKTIHEERWRREDQKLRADTWELTSVCIVIPRRVITMIATGVANPPGLIARVVQKRVASGTVRYPIRASASVPLRALRWPESSTGKEREGEGRGKGGGEGQRFYRFGGS